jgi:endoglucanase
MLSLFRYAVVLFAAILIARVHAADAPSLLSNGDFSQATANPAWPNDWGQDKGISWETGNGTHFLRLTQQESGKMLADYREMPIPAGVKGLEVTARYRTTGVVHGKAEWMRARVIFHFLDGARKQVDPDPGLLDFGNDTKVWAEDSITCVVPEGATTLVLMPCLFEAQAGTVDFQFIHVIALDDSVVAAMQAKSAAIVKREADRAATIAQGLALPSSVVELKASGNQLVTPDGKSIVLQGVNVPSLEWSPYGEGKIIWSVYVATHNWYATLIRLPVIDPLWFGRGPNGEGNDSSAYRTLVDQAIKIASVNGAHVVLDLHRYTTPDQSCIDFWKDAAARYKNNPAVLFDLLNENHDTSWEVWQKGDSVEEKRRDGTSKTIHGVGMQALVDTVRGTGAHNIIVAGGLEWAFDLTGVLKGYALDDKGGNGIMYATHFYNWHRGWSAHFMAVAAKYPILVGEMGADIKKMDMVPADQQEDPYTWAPDALGFVQKNHLNWTGWCLHNSATPAMLLDLDDYTPTPYWGQFVKDALGGKQFTMKKER